MALQRERAREREREDVLPATEEEPTSRSDRMWRSRVHTWGQPVEEEASPYTGGGGGGGFVVYHAVVTAGRMARLPGATMAWTRW
jgi:hypothetical protein